METQNPSEIPELSAEQQKNIREIAELDLGAETARDIILVYVGEKPATEITVIKWGEPADKLIGTLKRLGISVVEKQIPLADKVTAELCISLNPQLAEELSTLSPQSDHERYGQLMGFPQSAVDAFIGRTPRAENDLTTPRNVANADLIIGMGRSAKNFETETAFMRRWSNIIKRYAPKVYEGLLPQTVLPDLDPNLNAENQINRTN